MRGRKPRSTQTKKLTGNPGGRPLNAREPEPPPLDAWNPPLGELTDPVALAEWNRLAPLLRAARQITEADRGVLVALCVEWARYLDATREVRTQGLVIKASRRATRCRTRTWRSPRARSATARGSGRNSGSRHRADRASKCRGSTRRAIPMSAPSPSLTNRRAARPDPCTSSIGTRATSSAARSWRGKYHRLACVRHLRDRAREAARARVPVPLRSRARRSVLPVRRDAPALQGRMGRAARSRSKPHQQFRLGSLLRVGPSRHGLAALPHRLQRNPAEERQDRSKRRSSRFT